MTRDEAPHSEFLFLKIYDKSLYLPLSSVARTFRHYNKADFRLSPQNPPKDIKQKDISFKLVEFSELSGPLSPSYRSVNKFIKAIMKCNIGLTHPKREDLPRQKKQIFDSLAFLTGNPSVFIMTNE